MKILSLMLVLALFASCTTIRPIGATSNKVSSKMGKSCAKTLFHVIPLGGENSIYSAAKNGGVSMISTVDQEIFDAYVYNTNCTIVRGR